MITRMPSHLRGWFPAQTRHIVDPIVTLWAE